MTSEKVSPSVPKPKWRYNWRKIIVYLLSIIVVHRLFLILFTSAHRPKAHLVESSQQGYGQLYHGSWQALTQALNDARPTISSVGSFVPVAGISVESVEVPTSVDVLELSTINLAAMRKSHKKFVKNINERKLSVIYQRGQQGIVVTAGLDDLPAVLVQLRLLRRTGSLLPVEVFLLTQEDYDLKICRDTLPKLNAQCKILEEHTDAFPLPKMPGTNRERNVVANEPLHKLLALFFTKFEEVLLLDPATLVYNNPDVVVKEEPFLSTGMLIWPDFWASTVSPKLFAIQEAPEEKKTRRDNIRTVDFGQMVLSKSQHSATLLLAIYYTYFGEKLYDSLLQQSLSGERGSQAIKSAARFLEAPYYMIKRHVEAVGYPDMDKSNQGFHGVAMLQAFASDDFHRFPKDRQRPLFLRANNPKLHAGRIMKEGVTSFGGKTQGAVVVAAASEAIGTSLPEVSAVASGLKKIKGPRIVAHRMWEWFSARHVSNGWRDPDPERAVWEEIWKVACKDVRDFNYWPEDDVMTARTCQRISKHREDMGWSEFFVM
ncbi:hypothetical protein CBS101457_005409 [Exobasidium rhododendri]|nr:hypothetical protein CBS101457_005409 [Exobasidium rhododendri]